MSRAQIYKPETGRTYRITSGEHVFIGRVTGWDLETVTVEPVEPTTGVKSLRLKRGMTKFQEWL